MMGEIGNLLCEIAVWNDAINRLPEPAADENPNVTKRRKDLSDSVEKATRRVNELNAFHTEVTKYRTIPELRVIGSVLHSSPIKVSVQPFGYTEDWGFIELDRAQIDWDTFLGNKVFVGTSFPSFWSLPPPFCRTGSFYHSNFR